MGIHRKNTIKELNDTLAKATLDEQGTVERINLQLALEVIASQQEIIEKKGKGC